MKNITCRVESKTGKVVVVVSKTGKRNATFCGLSPQGDCPLPPTRPSLSRRHFSASALHSPLSRQRSALRPRSSRGSSFTFRFPHVSFAIRPHQAVDAFNSARSISPSCAGPSAPSLRRIRLHRPLAYATIGSRQSSALQRFAERVLCIG